MSWEEVSEIEFCELFDRQFYRISEILCDEADSQVEVRYVTAEGPKIAMIFMGKGRAYRREKNLPES